MPHFPFIESNNFQLFLFFWVCLLYIVFYISIWIESSCSYQFLELYVGLFRVFIWLNGLTKNSVIHL